MAKKETLLKRKVKYYELENIQAGIGGLNGISDVDLGIYRSRISRKIAEELEASKTFMQSDEWLRVNKLIDAIAMKYAKKREDGSPITSENGRIMIDIELVPKYNEEMDALKKKEKTAFDDRDKQEKRFKAKMKEDTDFELNVIPLSLFKRIEKEYTDAEKDKPFKSETMDQLGAIIDYDN